MVEFERGAGNRCPDAGLPNVTTAEEPGFAVYPETGSDLLQCPFDDGHLRWRPHESFHHLFEQSVDTMGAKASRRAIALECPDRSYSFAELEAHANRIARYLQSRDVRAGDRVVLLFDRSIHSYAGTLAVSKLGAACVPLDAAFPKDRLAYILEDSDVAHVVTVAEFAGLFDDLGRPVIVLDVAGEEIGRLPSKRPEPQPTPEDGLCYIIYTSGSTGRPKGVRVNHSSICNFLRVACETYGYRADDRVYQALTIAFDFSFEEIWVPLLSGACLVPAPSGINLVADDLADFLAARNISALCCVPTLLATVDRDLPDLRLLIVSGETCPADLVARWWTPERRFLNLYGPTETTVTATWADLQVGGEVTIGQPLPTYTIMILVPGEAKLVRPGETGEICVAGIGVADGYQNREEETARVFIEDFCGTENNPTARIYRTGDLGRINERRELEYHGRIDTQVKIRGYRIELDEIEAVAREAANLAAVVVNPVETEPGSIELAVYYTCPDGKAAPEAADLHDALRQRLPEYMVPAFYEKLEAFPLLPSGKVDRKKLPAPGTARLTAAGKSFVLPKEGCETELAALLASLLKLERISADADFFTDLGANSLLMARYLASVRKTLGVKRLSMKQLYQCSTVEQLAAALEPQLASKAEAAATAPVPETPKTASMPVTESAAPVNGTGESFVPPVNGVAAPPAMPAARADTSKQGTAETRIASTFEYVMCGVLQVAYYAVLAFVLAFGIVVAFGWINSATTLPEIYLRAAAGMCAYTLCTSALLIAVKWIMVGRFTTEPVPLWSLRYVRFWIAQSAIRSNPLNIFAGTEIYSIYLRLLGARIGRRAIILAPAPICTDLVSIGDDTIVRQASLLPGYAARAGYIRPGRITVGARCFIGEATVLCGNTSIGDDVQLGTQSVVLEDGTLESGKCYQGTPAAETRTDFVRVPPMALSALRRNSYIAFQLATMLLIAFPLSVSVAYLLVDWGVPSLTSGAGGSATVLDVTDLLAYSAGLYLGGIALALLTVTTVPRLLNLFFVADRPHPLFGVQFVLAGAIARLSNSRVLHELFGDSSMIVHYFKAVGYDLSETTQTGSNFGVEQRHHSPFLCKFSRNTLVSDGLVMVNTDMSSTTFKVSAIAMPPDTYLGNDVHFPVGAKLGPNCLIATKAMVPIDGPVRQDVGILGSPPFAIPRSVAQDSKFDHYKRPGVLEERLKLKLHSNLVTLALFMFRNWSALFLVMLGSWVLYYSLWDVVSGTAAGIAVLLTGVMLLSLWFTAIYFILYERGCTLLKPMKPRYCSLYDRAFWDHERFWKLNINHMLAVFDGTPFKTMLTRLQGVKVGRQVFDNGVAISEPGMVEIGDYCCLNHRAVLQGHSLEDGTFKSDAIRLGARCTVEVNGFVHYGSTVEDDATVAAHAFVMKGSTVATGETWSGNPAQPGSEYGAEPITAARVRAKLNLPFGVATDRTGVNPEISTDGGEESRRSER